MPPPASHADSGVLPTTGLAWACRLLLETEGTAVRQPGEAPLESFLVLPHPDSARLLVPLATPAAGGAAAAPAGPSPPGPRTPRPRAGGTGRAGAGHLRRPPAPPPRNLGRARAGGDVGPGRPRSAPAGVLVRPSAVHGSVLNLFDTLTE